MGKRSHSNKSETSEDDVKRIKSDDGKKVSKRKHKHKEKHKKRHKKEKKRKIKAVERCETTSDAGDASVNDDRLLSDRAKAMAPMTKEEWEKRQSVVRKVFDEETGRTRLVKGDGEILEEIVSKQEHSRINKTATKNDGQYFQKNLMSKLK